jgi:hypothetical protein
LAIPATCLEEFQELRHALTRFRREGQNRHAGPDGPDVFVGGRGVELDSLG